MDFIEIKSRITEIPPKTPKGRVRHEVKLETLEKIEFINEALPLLGSLPIMKGEKSPEKILKNLNTLEYIDTPNGSIDSKQLRSLLYILRVIPRSKLYTGSVPNKHKSLTPLLLYALKKQQGFKYEYWEKEELYMPMWLGYFMWEELKPYRTKILNDADILKLRNIQISKKGVKHHQLAAGVKGKNTTLGMHIMMQTWVASEELREPDCMILDLQNWDNTPDLLANETPIQESSTNVSEIITRLDSQQLSNSEWLKAWNIEGLKILETKKEEFSFNF